MEQIEFIYTPNHSIRFVKADNGGYVYRDTGDEVEIGTTVHSGKKISFCDFIDLIKKHEYRYLLDALNERVVTLISFKDNEGNHINCVDCANRFYDEQYLPWEEFKKYNNVIIEGNKFILMKTGDDFIEFTLLCPATSII